MIWSTIVGGIVSLTKSWFEKKEAANKAEADLKQRALTGEIDYDLYAMQQKQWTILDDIIGIVFTAPFIVAWFDPDRAMKWVTFVDNVPAYYWAVYTGIVASTFGLRWWFKGKNVVARKQND